MKKTKLPLFYALVVLLFCNYQSAFAFHNRTKAESCSWSAPLNLRDSLRGSNSMYLSWNTPVEGTPSGGYKIRVLESNTNIQISVINTNGLSVQITGLKAGTLYDLEVSSVCGDGTSGPVARTTLPTIVVEFVVNGGNLQCSEPAQPPLPSTADIYNPNVPTCTGANTGNNCSGIYYSYPDIFNQNNIQIFNFKVSTGQKYYWFALERNPNNHYKIKPKGFYQNVSAQLVGNYLNIKSGSSVVFAQVGIFENGFHFTRTTSNTVVGITDKFSECIIPELLVQVNDVISDNVIGFNNFNVEDKKNALDQDMICFPNPTENMINVMFSEQLINKVSISIFDITGIEIINKTYEAASGNFLDNIKIDISDLKSGVYILNSDYGMRKSFVKFIKL